MFVPIEIRQREPLRGRRTCRQVAPLQTRSGLSKSVQELDAAERRMYNGVMRLLALADLTLMMLVCGACGYQVRSSVRELPAGIQSLGIPTFTNRSPQYKLEQQLTAAVLKEFSTRTRVPVNSSPSSVDAILRGEIQSISSTPVTFGSDSFGSAFLVSVQISVKLVRSRDGSVLWENPSFQFRERYVLNGKVSDFFSEQGAALDRLARDCAASLASTILNR